MPKSKKEEVTPISSTIPVTAPVELVGVGKGEARISELETAMKNVLGLVARVAAAQAQHTVSGSGWLSQINFDIQKLEKAMGWGPGPRHDKPL